MKPNRFVSFLTTTAIFVTETMATAAVNSAPAATTTLQGLASERVETTLSIPAITMDGKMHGGPLGGRKAEGKWGSVEIIKLCANMEAPLVL